MSKPIQTKTCRVCKETKPISEFYKNKHCKDGYLNDCKACQNEAIGKYRKTEKGKIVNRRGQKRFKTRYPNYVKASNTINNAIQSGKLVRPNTRLCHYCPNPAQEYHHWHGYEKAQSFDVVPVCISCHNYLRIAI